MVGQMIKYIRVKPDNWYIFKQIGARRGQVQPCRPSTIIPSNTFGCFGLTACYMIHIISVPALRGPYGSRLTRSHRCSGFIVWHIQDI